MTLRDRYSMHMRETYQQIMALGPHCRPKAQIQRIFGKQIAKRHVFDWQSTPYRTLIEYFRRDFVGMFELADLTVRNGSVFNVRYQTSHSHEFPEPTLEGLAEHYPIARRMHDHWCESTREYLDNDLSTLFVLGEPVSSRVEKQIEAVLAARCSHKRYRLLPGPIGDYSAGLPGDLWIGDCKLWKRHLAPFEISNAKAIPSVVEDRQHVRL